MHIFTLSVSKLNSISCCNAFQGRFPLNNFLNTGSLFPKFVYIYINHLPSHRIIGIEIEKMVQI